jgi:transcriptional regulator with XRE-family HTH domain
MVDTQNVLKIKTAIVLGEMLAEAQAKGSINARIADKKIAIHNSLGKISVETGITKSALSDIFSGKSGTKINTLVPILSALNKSFVDFAKRFEKVTDSDIQKFKERSNLKKPVAVAKKKIKK